jgi:hypothetical protein
VLARYGKTITPAAQRAALGKRPLDCWAAVAKELDIPAAPETLLEETEQVLAPRSNPLHHSHRRLACARTARFMPVPRQDRQRRAADKRGGDMGCGAGGSIPGCCPVLRGC